jgi:hypothetical protein
MKEKIVSALKTKYKTFGFSDKAFDGVADYLSKTITEEKDIETAIGGVENLLKAFQGESDRLRTENAELKKKAAEKETKPAVTDEGKSEEDKPLTKADILALFKERDKEQESKSTFEEKKSTALANLEKKGVKVSVAKKFAAQIAYDETLTSEDIQAKIQAEYDEVVSAVAPEAGKPSVGGAGGSNVSSEISDYIAEKKAEIEKSKPKS